MAVPVYSTDLSTRLITDAETTTGWAALGGGASGLSASPDLSMQGTNCVDKNITAAEKGQVFDSGGTTIGAGEHIFTWLYVATPGLTALLASRGVSVVIGSATNAYVQYHVEGSDTYGAAGRVGKCYVVDYSVRTANTGSIPYRTVTGNPGATPGVFGGIISTVAAVKGSNLGVDAIRYGKGAYITAGDSGTPATFAGFNAISDAVANRYGLLTKVGASYELQGMFAIGQDTAGTPTLAYFEDANATIVLVDTPHSAADFTQIVVDHASTVFNLSNVSITALGTNNPGRLIYNNASTVSALTSVALTGIGISTLRAGVTATSCTWRSCDTITQNGATITGCTITSSTGTVGLVSDTPASVTSCTFVSAGTGHAIEILTPGTFTWSNNDSGYGTTGTTDATVYNNSGGLVTINVAAGASTPTYLNGASATTSVVSGQITLTLTGLIANTEVRMYSAGTTTELAGIENSATSFGYTYTYAPSTFVDIVVHHVDYEYIKLSSFLLSGSDSSLPIQQTLDRWYSNP